MAASLGNIFVKLGLDVKPFEQGMSRAQKSARGHTDKIGTGLKKLRNAFAALSAVAGVGLGLGASIKEAAAYETALTGVVKTTGLAGAELKSLEDQLGGITRRFATTTSELLGLAEAAGQMGVQGADNLARFAETMARMAVASDVAGEEGGKAIVRLLNITGEGVGVIDRFSSALVALGNSSAASEGEILHMATFLGQSVAAFRVTSAEVLGLSAAMKSMGLRAESAGSAVGRAFLVLSKSKEFRDNPMRGFIQFLEALRDEGDNATNVLKDMKLAGDENLKVFPLLAKNVDQVRIALGLSNDEWRNNTALMKESEQFNKTYAAQVVIFQNNLRALSVMIGQEVLPAITSILETVNFVFSSAEHRTEIFKATALATLFEMGMNLENNFKTVFAAIMAAVVNAGEFIIETFADTFDQVIIGAQHMANKFASVLNNLPGVNIGETDISGLKFNYDRAGFNERFNDALDLLKVDENAVNPFDSSLQEAIAGANAEQAKWDERGLPANDAAGALYNAGLPMGDGDIDLSLFGGAEAAKEASKEVTRFNDEVERVSATVKGFDERVKTVQPTLSQWEVAMADIRGELARFGETTFDRMTDFVTEFAETGKVNFKKFANSAIFELARIQLKALATRAILGLAGQGGTIGNIFSSVAGAFGIGARAAGGPVTGGSAYIVGERGPELMIPKQSGAIIPNHELMSGGGRKDSPAVVVNQENHFEGDANPRTMGMWAAQVRQQTINDIAAMIQNGGQPALLFAQ